MLNPKQSLLGMRRQFADVPPQHVTLKAVAEVSAVSTLIVVVYCPEQHAEMEETTHFNQRQLDHRVPP